MLTCIFIDWSASKSHFTGILTQELLGYILVYAQIKYNWNLLRGHFQRKHRNLYDEQIVSAKSSKKQEERRCVNQQATIIDHVSNSKKIFYKVSQTSSDFYCCWFTSSLSCWERTLPWYDRKGSSLVSSSVSAVAFFLAKVSAMHQEIMQRLQMADKICRTIDLWSSRQMRYYHGETGHFIVD